MIELICEILLDEWSDPSQYASLNGADRFALIDSSTASVLYGDARIATECSITLCSEVGSFQTIFVNWPSCPISRGIKAYGTGVPTTYSAILPPPVEPLKEGPTESGLRISWPPNRQLELVKQVEIAPVTEAHLFFIDGDGSQPAIIFGDTDRLQLAQAVADVGPMIALGQFGSQTLIIENLETAVLWPDEISIAISPPADTGIQALNKAACSFLLTHPAMMQNLMIAIGELTPPPHTTLDQNCHGS